MTSLFTLESLKTPKMIKRKKKLGDQEMDQLSYEQARDLYEKAEKALLRVQVSVRGFIFSRWLLGSYFSTQKKLLGSKWSSWLKEKWPEVSSQTALLWVSFYKKNPIEMIKDVELPTLRNNFISNAIRPCKTNNSR